ncbi:uncharacterized protein LOC130178868 [Seriola aureovittata]|uniref:uncharacterized protein LOC130178868 n=1 Tax=Seriola aureovittata TaxID=2871759 RepID=UPI0024BEC027|nr:uncharacterized protein LOC130178868 [Seriola aureovittata]
MLFLQDLYPNLSACRIPTFNQRKLFEVKGILKTSTEEWKSEIKDVVMAQISPSSYREGRAALVICETINAAKELHEELKSIIPGQIILYNRSDKDSLSKIDKTLDPGDVIVATNLAGRGTDIKVSEKVNNNGGLFVILSFLSENSRVELQAFGRTARKGKPGSAQVIMTTDHLQDSFKTVSSLEEAKETRDKHAAERIKDMMNDVTEMRLREDLFSEYCKTLEDIYRNTDGDEERAVVAMMNEFWGIWLQTKSEEIDQLKRTELQKSLKDDLSLARSQCQSQTSPCSSIYHYIKFGNIKVDEKQWDISKRLFEKAMEQDESWAAIAFYSHAYCTIKQEEKDYLTKARDDLRKAQDSLKYLSEECMVCLQLVKMSSAHSANSQLNQTSLEKQFLNKCNMFKYFDENISKAIKKLEEIKDKGRDAIANKSPMFSLMEGADEDLQAEADNLYRQGLKYVFSVEEKPRFPWEAFLVFCLGFLQIIAGALLTVFTFGALAQVGMGLITEGISDCIYGIESMVTGEFSWKSWAIDKAISIGVSLIGFGIGKLIAKGFKACKLLIKQFGKHLKSLPKFFSRQAKDGFSVVAKMNMKNAVKYTAKKMAEEVISYGLGKAEEELLKKILNDIKDKMQKEIVNDVKSNMEKEPLATLVDSIILSHLEDKQQLSDLVQEEKGKNKLLAIFKELSKTALQPFYADLSWQNKLNSTLSKVIKKAKSGVKGGKRLILTAIEAIHMGALATDAIITVHSLSDKFFLNLQKDLNKFNQEKESEEKVKRNDLSDSETKMLKEFKQDLADTISALLADALVEVFHQKFSSHIVSHVQGKVNDIIGDYVKKGLKTDRTEEKLRAGQNNRYIAYMPRDLNSKDKLPGKHSQSHAEKIKNPMIGGSILDIRVLSETTGTKVIILTEDSHGKLKKMQELNPGTKPASQTVTLIYRPKSSQNPDGHYDVQINNKMVTVTSEGKGCLFHALARGMKPEASDEEITLEADRLRSVEADTLLKHPGQWEGFVKRKEWTDTIRGGDWYMGEGAGLEKIKETKEWLQKEVGNVQFYRDLQNRDDCIGKFIHADHQPPVRSILDARNLNQNSRLAEAFLEVGTDSHPLDTNLISKVKENHGLGLLSVNVPAEVHRELPSTTNKEYRKLLARTISQDDVVGTFKLTILGSMPRFKLIRDKNLKDFNNSEVSKTRLASFEQSFPQLSTKLLHKWYNQFRDKGVMTEDHLNSVTDWINNRGYDNQNDPLRNQVADLP